jgi:DNA-directed RNA polymerase subunit M/transcription elongation factor TFIIS
MEEQRSKVRMALSRYGCRDMEQHIYETSQQFDHPYAKHAYEIIGVISTSYPIEKTQTDMSFGKTNFALSFFNVYMEAKLNKIRITNLKPESTEGLFVCKRCKGNKFWVWSAQTRSADEGMTTFAQCTVCPPELGRFKC